MRPLPAIVSALNAQEFIAALVVDRVYGGELPKHEIAAGPRHCVVVQQAPGGRLGPGARSYLPWRVIRLSIRSYGETPNDADDLDAKVYEYMTEFHGLVDTIHETILRDAVVSGGPLSQRDPDIRWPCVISMYELSASPICQTVRE